MAGVAWTGEGWAKDTIPDHYRGEQMEPWDIWEAFCLDPWSANAIKYILRAGRKDSAVDDYRKAQHYLQYLIDKEESYAQEGPSTEDYTRAFARAFAEESGEAPEGPLREAQKVAREMADPEYVEPHRGLDVADPNMSLEEDPSSGKLRWYLDRFHNKGRS